MTPAEIIRRAVADQAVALVEGQHDGVGDAAIEALKEQGWMVVRLQRTYMPDPLSLGPLYRIVDEA